MAEPSAKRRKTKEAKSDDGPTITDPRFANIQSDPRFRLPSKRHTQVKVDKRFSQVLEDDDFVRKAKVDRYGRPLEAGGERKRLKRRYNFEDEDDEPDDEDEVQNELLRVEKLRDPLREGLSGDDSENSSSSEEEGEDGELPERGLAEQLEGEVPMGEVSSRIAVVNLDWDNIRAEDLMAVFSSFLPATGRLLKVSIYQSEFGRERMEREEMEGPPQEIFAKKQEEIATSLDSDSEQEDDEDEDEIKASILKAGESTDFDSVKLRQYQLERLRYFYAVLTFSSAPDAKAIYDAVDGAEYLSTANFFDLRFVPDETDFSSDKPREECRKIPEGYKPNDFVTDALQHSKVKLTWDAEDGSRKEAQARAFRGGREAIDENDLKAYLGSDTSEDEDEVETNLLPFREQQEKQEPTLSKKEQARLDARRLLGLGKEPAKTPQQSQGPVGDIQVTFSSGLNVPTDENGQKRSVFEETTVEKYQRKEKERKQRRKQKNKPTEDPPTEEPAEEDLGFDDPFFAADAEAAKTSSTKIRNEERLKKRAELDAEARAAAAQRAELELLTMDDRAAEMRHFDMGEIEKAEKRARKKGKHARKQKEEAEMRIKEDGFEMDTRDPRFERLYQSHEFAIDPSNPRFKGTRGMRALLDEGRKRRKGGDGEGEGKSIALKEGGEREGEEVRRLVEQVKRKRTT